MIPRGKLDIPFSNILRGIRYCFSAGLFPDPIYKSPVEKTPKLITLSVRTGFDLVLEALNFPPGTEILVTDINIPDMFNIISAHQLIAVPLSLNKYSLQINPEEIEAAIGPATKAILITHLFGGITPLNQIQEIANKHQLILLEDCAQAFQGNGYNGHPKSDVLMYSFGMIKTNTAITGAVIQINDHELYSRVNTLNNQLPIQKVSIYFKKLIKAMLISLLSRRIFYTFFYKIMSAGGKDFDQLLSSFTRGFPGNDPLNKIRYRPCKPNQLLLEKRLSNFKEAQFSLRQKLFRDVLADLPKEIQIGCSNLLNTNWVIPIECRYPEEMISHLHANGYDATAKASSLVRLPNSVRTQEKPDQLLLTSLVYLPMDTSMSSRERIELGRLIREKLP